MSKLEIKACPFCGSTEVKTVVDDGIHFEQCAKCEATGPTGFKRGDEDDVNWNSRAPVPPAGGVEVLGRDIYAAMGGEYAEAWRACHDALMPRITRLAAERDGLLGKIETTDKAYDIVVETSRQMFVEMQHLQSELTKERALLARIRSELSVLPRENWWVHIAIDDLLAPQSAPAAKDGESGETICLLCFDKKTVPGPKHGDFVRDCPECCGEEG